MNVLILDEETMGLAFAMRAMEDGHYVKLWMPDDRGEELPVGQGIVDRPKSWKKHMGWADLIVPTGNTKLIKELEPFFESGYPIFGSPREAVKLELDRAFGQQVLSDHDIDTLPFEEFHDFDAAIKHVQKTGKAYACKPWGGAADKSLSCVADSPEDMIFILERWRDEGKKADFILQEKVDGVEIGVAGFFGPSGWCGMIEESWEEKKFLAGNLGQNTGEMGTTIRYARQSALFNRILAPLTGFLLDVGAVGDVAVNCIVGEDDGLPWPLEFTMRLGWPDFNIRMHLHTGDLAQQMLDCLKGKDTFECIPEVAVGVMQVHGDFPWNKKDYKDMAGYPLRGLTSAIERQLSFQHVMWGKAPVRIGASIHDAPCYTTAGDHVLVAVGTGQSINSARLHAYDACEAVTFPSNRGYRIDIAQRLKKQLPLLQKHGYCKDLTY